MATLAATPSTQQQVVNLPKRLLDFFARYPPRLYGVHFTRQKLESLKEKIAREGNKKTGDPPHGAAVAEASTPLEALPSILEAAETQAAEAVQIPSTLLDPETSEPLFSKDDQPPNPFLAYRNPATGRWRGATVSLRRQGELFKLARAYGVEPLLPASMKSTSFKEARLLERGLAVKGTGVGQKVKGHKWERIMEPMLEKRIQAMERMPELIREWRMRGNGRGWKKWPK